MSNTYRATKTGARKLFTDALSHVESARIRAWATSEHNRPIWEGEALARIRAGRLDPITLATSIVSHAIGL